MEAIYSRAPTKHGSTFANSILLSAFAVKKSGLNHSAKKSMRFRHVFRAGFSFVHLPPGVPDISQNKRNHQRDVTHDNQRVMTRRAVFDVDAALQEFAVSGIITSVVESGGEEERKNRQYRSDAGKPNPFGRGFETAQEDSRQHQHDANQEQNPNNRQFYQVVKIFVRLHEDQPRFVVCKTVSNQDVYQKEKEAYQKRNRRDFHRFHRPFYDVFVVDVVDEIERAQDTRQEKHRQTKRKVDKCGIARKVESQLQSARLSAPYGTDGTALILNDFEERTGKKRRHRRPQ